jgi:hypothetical protein
MIEKTNEEVNNNQYPTIGFDSFGNSFPGIILDNNDIDDVDDVDDTFVFDIDGIEVDVDVENCLIDTNVKFKGFCF